MRVVPPAILGLLAVASVTVGGPGDPGPPGEGQVPPDSVQVGPDSVPQAAPATIFWSGPPQLTRTPSLTEPPPDTLQGVVVGGRRWDLPFPVDLPPPPDFSPFTALPSGPPAAAGALSRLDGLARIPPAIQGPRVGTVRLRVATPFPVAFPPPPGLDHYAFLPLGGSLVQRGLDRLNRVARSPLQLRPIPEEEPDPEGQEEGEEAEETVAVADTSRFLPDVPERRRPRDRPTGRPGAGPQAAPPETDTVTQVIGEDALPDFFTQYADLGMRLRGRGELGGDWVRFQPCDIVGQFNCNPSIFPQLDPDVQFGIQIQGTVSDRVHVNVDFDQNREFSAANNINVWYEGQEDEIVQLLEMGDVTFSLPESRFLTQGIPAGNFGFRAAGQVGPIDFQTVWAQQKGDLSEREFQLSGVGSSQGFVQEDTLVLDDADYVDGQFFFLFHPTSLVDHPHVDILSLDPASAPGSVVPGAEPIQLYRFENDPVTRQQVEGYIQADAVATLAGDTVTESGWFRFLQPGVDYFVHPSGLWIALRSPLRREEMLAVTYVTASGDTVGDYNPEQIHNQGGRPVLRLLRASSGLHQPGRPTWDIEMHNVYRVSGSSDVELGSVELDVSLGELSAGQTFARGPTGEDITYLRLFGLDEESPVDQLDRSFVYKPADDAFSDQPPVNGTFIVFPTLEPFQTPPPVPSLGLSAQQTDQILGTDENTAIYEALDPFDRENGGLFRLTIPFRVRSEGLISSFSLGALGIRDGSERIMLGNRVLQRREDYIIDYDLGQVTLLDAQNLFGSTSNTDLRATFEQKSIFQLAPTSVFGLNARYDLGERGALNFMGLLQSESDLVRRPQLGVEAASIFLGGVNGDLSFDAPWLDRALDHVPGLRWAGESDVQIRGELALSLPNPNTQGAVFLDDFDATNQIPVSVGSPAWRLGSAPEFREGALDELPPALDQTDLTDMTWQHTWVVRDQSGDSTGVFEGFNPQEDIDRQIRVAGNQTLREPGLLMTLGVDETLSGQPFDRRRWRSVTTVLSTTGLDLTKTEVLEVYVAGGDSADLVLDLGQVSEDALFVDEQGQVNGTKPGGRPWGLGLLDQEADPRQGEVWNQELDRLGVWGESCQAFPGAAAYPVASDAANCTRNNGRLDTEDLDGDGNLDQSERYMRYVVNLDGSSPYLARDRSETGTEFRLYRIPLRGANAVNVGGLFTEADFRAVKHLRMTVAANRGQALILARPRLVGSRWTKRARTGVVRGLAGDTTSTGGEVDLTSVSDLTVGTAYQAPPGVLEQLDDPTQGFGGQGVEFNEKSLGIEYRDVGPGERVEVWSRFPQRPRNFLTYRQARIWALARAGDWGPSEPRFFFVKVGNDSENFYLYRTRLDLAANPGSIGETDWLPEIVVDFENWLDLRRRAEGRLISDPPAPTDPPLVLWDADSTYAVVLRDRGRAPNLAAVRELSMGVLNQGQTITQGEVWVNEFRLSQPVRDPGTASYVDMDLNAADVLTTRLSYEDRGPLFRQLDGDPSYQQDRSMGVNSTLRLDRFTPAGWGIDLPVTVSHSETTRDPTFLNGSDVRADALTGLRETGSRRTRVGISFRKRTPAANPVVNALLNGLDARVGYSTSSASTVTSESSSEVFDARLGYDRRLEPRDVDVVPGFLEPVLRALLPGFLEDRVAGARFRWSPERLSLATSFFKQENRNLRFEQILRLPEDSAVTPTLSPREGLESSGQVVLRPFQSITADMSIVSTRDLLDPRDAVADPKVRPLLRAERSRLQGIDVGWETSRSVRTQLGFRPGLSSWLITDYRWTTFYSADRNANFVERRLRPNGDTVRALQRNVNGQRNQQATASLQTGGLVESLLGPDEGQEEGFWTRGLRFFAGMLAPLQGTWQDGLTTRFNRQTVDPRGEFQLGFGDVDDFRFMDGDTAATVGDRTSWSTSSGLRLFGLSADVGYAEAQTETLDTRSDRSTDSKTWPDVRGSIPDVPLPGFVSSFVTRLGVSSGYRKQVQGSDYGAQSRQNRVQVDEAIPLEVSLRVGQGTSMSYRGNFQEGEGTDPTGNTERLRTTHSFSLSSSFTPPGDFGDRLARPLRISAQFRYNAQSDCRITSGQSECVSFVDQLNRTLNVTVDTRISAIDLGLQASYTNRQSFIGQNPGSTQFQIGFFGEFLFAAGELGAR